MKQDHPRIVRQRRLRLRVGGSRLFLESRTTIDGDASTFAHVCNGTSAINTAARLSSPLTVVGLLLHLGHEGLGRALKWANGRGLFERLSPVAGERFLGLRIGQRVLVTAGLVIDAWQMAKAIRRSFVARSIRPATAQAARSLTTWGAIWAGVELFGTGGALIGIELGPGVIVTTAIGATVGGCVGLFAGNWVAAQIDCRVGGDASMAS